MMPQSYRSVSAILVGISQEFYAMLDCGEGTYVQLCDQFGDELEKVLRKLKIVYLTHLHGDHFFGIFNLIYQRSLLFNGDKDE